MKLVVNQFVIKQMQQNVHNLLKAAMLMALLTVPALAQDPPPESGTAFCGFMNNIQGILNVISIGVVTIAIIFAGYQIAFAHKRISDVAPILIGGLLIGAAGQIAKMLLAGQDFATSCSGF